jgi:hypothetical protein
MACPPYGNTLCLKLETFTTESVEYTEKAQFFVCREPRNAAGQASGKRKRRLCKERRFIALAGHVETDLVSKTGGKKGSFLPIAACQAIALATADLPMGKKEKSSVTSVPPW